MRLTARPRWSTATSTTTGFGGGPFRLFLRWNGTRYATLDEVRKRAPVFKHAVLVDAATAFASGALPPEDVAKPQSTPIDFRPAAGSTADRCRSSTAGLERRLPRPPARTSARTSWATRCPITGRECKWGRGAGDGSPAVSRHSRAVSSQTAMEIPGVPVRL